MVERRSQNAEQLARKLHKESVLTANRFYQSVAFYAAGVTFSALPESDYSRIPAMRYLGIMSMMAGDLTSGAALAHRLVAKSLLNELR